MKKIILYALLFNISVTLYSQSEIKYSSVNPALMLYTNNDVFINPLIKYNSGKNVIKPEPSKYPWESRLENGMPNVIKDGNGNLSIYISSWVSYSNVPPSKMGVMVYTNNSNYYENWVRPDAGLFWYNPQGKSGDEKISSIYNKSYLPTNIVAVDIESFGIYDDKETSIKPIKLIYLPQRESFNKIIAGYEMNRSFNANGILSDFSKMKSDRITNQKLFTFKFINGDTHMNYLKQNNKYYFVSRLNSKRSYIKQTESLPFSPDPRKRYRRETITEIGDYLTSKNVELNISLDMSNSYWEPYSMQPFRLESFEKDIWWGLVTMFGTEGEESVQYKQRTELAISNDGIHWRYLKAGTPFLDNGTDPKSDDYGCINIAKPVIGTKLSTNPNDVLYFYAASNDRHVSGRNPGISLAMGKNGKTAGLKAENVLKYFYSMSPKEENIPESYMPKYSISSAFQYGSSSYPYILADITDDPRNKSLSNLNSFVKVSLYTFDSTKEHGKGKMLCSVLGSSTVNTHSVSDNYEAVAYDYQGSKSNNKNLILEYLKDYSIKHPNEIVSVKNFPEIATVIETIAKNAVFYGIKMYKSENALSPTLNLKSASSMPYNSQWSYIPEVTSNPFKKFSFLNKRYLPNYFLPTEKTTGAMIISLKPKKALSIQTILKLNDNEKNNIRISYDSLGIICYDIVKDGLLFSHVQVAPPKGRSFEEKDVAIEIECVKSNDRKYLKQIKEDITVLTVSCPSLSFRESAQQNIIWNWKHNTESVTPSDSANARGFAFLQFSSFIPKVDNIIIGADNETKLNEFKGSIYKVEIRDKLPSETEGEKLVNFKSDIISAEVNKRSYNYNINHY